MTRLLRQYLEALQLLEKVNDQAAASDSPAKKGGLKITHLDSGFLFESGEQGALLLIAAAEVHTKINKE